MKRSLENIHEKTKSRCYILDASKLYLADSQLTHVGRQLNLPEINNIFTADKGYKDVIDDSKGYCLAYAKAPGFETYTTGWYSII